MLFFSTQLDLLQSQEQPLEVFKISVLKHFAGTTEKTFAEVFFNKVEAFRPATLFKGDSNAGVFMYKLQKFLEHFFTENLWWLLLQRSTCFLGVIF